MATYKDLQDRINLDYLNRMTLMPEVKRAIAIAIRTYEANRYWFNETFVVLNAVTDQSFIPVPTDFLEPIRLELTVNGGTSELPRLALPDLRTLAMNSPSSQPTYYTYYGDRIELSCPSSGNYECPFYYVYSLPAFVSDDDSNAWTNEAANLIAHAATLELMTGVLQVHDTQKIARHQMLLEMAERELATRNLTRLTHRLRSTYF